MSTFKTSNGLRNIFKNQRCREALGYHIIQSSSRPPQFLIDSLFYKFFPFPLFPHLAHFSFSISTTLFESASILIPLFLLRPFLLEHFVIHIGRKIFFNTMWSTINTYLQFFQMADDTQYPIFIPPVQWCFPYYYPNMVPQYSQQTISDIENIRTYPYFPVWNYAGEGFENVEKQVQRADEGQAFSQTSAEYKSEQQQKKKRVQAPRFRPTKNNESNICNQAFSFMTNQSKSKTILQKLYKNKKKLDIFYEYTGLLSSNRKKYMSKGTLMKLCSITQSQPQLIEQIKQKSLSILTFQQLQNGVQFILVYFLKHKAISSILTSQKIAPEMRKDHIFKVREILNYLQQNIESRKKISGWMDKDLSVKQEC